MNLFAATSKIISGGGSKKMEHVNAEIAIQDTECQQNVDLSHNTIRGKESVLQALIVSEILHKCCSHTLDILK